MATACPATERSIGPGPARRAIKAQGQEFAARSGSSGSQGLVYAIVESPVGPLVTAATSKGLAWLHYGDDDGALKQLAAKISARLMHAPKKLDDVRRELDEYFEGRRTRFNLPLDWVATRPFQDKVLKATYRIPFGEVASYREVATEAGVPSGSRAAGNALGANPIPIVVPCHRVVRTGGGLGGYTGGLHRKEFLLKLEGAL